MKYNKVAIVYDWIDSSGGAERLLTELSSMFPHADWYTSTVNLRRASWASKLPITTSFIQKLPDFIKRDRIKSLFLYPFAFESFNFSRYDLVISVTSAFAKSVITRPETKHVCIILTPTRFLWGNSTSDYIKPSTQKLLAWTLSYLRKWDFVAAQRPDTFISISNEVKERVKNVYKRSSEVIYPPFDTHYWGNIDESKPIFAGTVPDNFYLVVSRLERYKKIELAIKACAKLNRNLLIVGTGSKFKTLKSLATMNDGNCQFLGRLKDEELAYLYNRADALIMPQEEDFGYTSLEAQSFGCPVVAYNKGGVLETIVNSKSGVLFQEQSVASLVSALEKLPHLAYNGRVALRDEAKQHLKKFDSKLFRERLTNIISE